MAKALKQKKMMHYDKEREVLYFGVQNGVEEEFVGIAPIENYKLKIEN